MAVLLPSVFCAFSAVAQISLSERLNYVLEAQDIEMGIKLYKEITDKDIEQLPDSSLFDYHFLGGFINSEHLPDDEKNYEKALSHFFKAKHLCETSLGIHSDKYMVTMYGLGNTYIDIGQYEEALGIFQEGIVKSTYMRVAASHDFGNLIMGVQECYERMGWYNEVPNLLMYAWSFWNKDWNTLETYAYWPLWKLREYYNRYEKYEDAIKTSDKILDFIIERGGESHPELAHELFSRGCILDRMGRQSEAIDTYIRGLSILEEYQLEYDMGYDYYNMLGNLIHVLIETEKWGESERMLNKMKDYCERSGDIESYNMALYSVAYILNKNDHYERAHRVVEVLLRRNLSEKRKEMAEFLNEQIVYSLEVINQIPDYEEYLQNAIPSSDDWFDVAFKLLCAYYRKKDVEKSMGILNSMYKCFPENKEAQDEFSYAVLGLLFEYNLNNENYDLALKYAAERLALISATPNFPDRERFDCINNIIVAKLKSNKLEGIYEVWDMAAQSCRNAYGEESDRYAILLHNKGRALQLEHKYDEAKQLYLDAMALHTKIKGHPMPNTVKYLFETNEQIINAELDL